MPPPPGTHEPVGSARLLTLGALRIERKQVNAAAPAADGSRDTQDSHITAWLTQYAKALPPGRVGKPLVVTDAGLRKMSDLDFFAAIGGLDAATRGLRLTARLRRTRPIVVRDAAFLQKAATAIFGDPIIKQVIPAPTMLHRYLQRDASFSKIYPTPGAFFRDLTTVYAGELRDLAKVGVRYVQLNDDNLPMLCEGFRGEMGKAQVLGFAKLINQVAARKPANMMIALHLRRNVSQPLPDMAAVLALLASALNIAGVMVDYERPNADDFAWLSALQPNAMAVLGLINGQSEALEAADDVLAALELAKEQLPKKNAHHQYLSLGIHGEGVLLGPWVEKLVLGERVASKFWRGVSG
jgi:methionine synthase II (cobalamin-independent)